MQGSRGCPVFLRDSGAEPAPASRRCRVRSARLHSLCSAHSLVIPVEAGALASFDEHSLTDAGLFTLAVLTTVCVEQEANRERQALCRIGSGRLCAESGAAACRRIGTGRSNSAVLGRGSGGEPFFRRKRVSPVNSPEQN